MINYQEIVEELTEENVKAILEKLNIPYVDKGAYLLMPTYCHNHMSEEASEKLYYYKNNKIFVCYTECGNMSIFKFLRNFYEAQGITYDWYEDIYKLITNVTGYEQKEGIIIPKYERLSSTYGNFNKLGNLPAYPLGALDCFVKKYPVEWLNDGISREAMDKFNIRYSISQNKIIIPHLDNNGRLVGIRGRALNEQEVELLGKYMPVQIEGTWYKHPLSMNLYGLYENKENIKKMGVAYLCESEKSVLQAESFSTPNCCVAVCGSNFNKFALKLLMQTAQPREIVICFDQEEIKGEHKYFDKLYNLCKKYLNYAQFSFIYDRSNLLNLKDSPTDKGENIFNELLRKRVRVI